MSGHNGCDIINPKWISAGLMQVGVATAAPLMRNVVLHDIMPKTQENENQCKSFHIGEHLFSLTSLVWG